jgi:hypothetical protein
MIAVPIKPFHFDGAVFLKSYSHEHSRFVDQRKVAIVIERFTREEAVENKETDGRE